MTSILIVATAAVLMILGVSCRRARLDLEEQLCDCLEPVVPAAAGFGPGGVPRGGVPRAGVRRARPALTGIDGGRRGCGDPAGHGRRHLRVVRAG
jgi:hypothetical protein